MSVYRPDRDLVFFNKLSEGCLPGLLGVKILQVGQGVLRAELAIEARHFAGNGFLHAGTVVTLADTGAGYACVAHLPEGASVSPQLSSSPTILARRARDGSLPKCAARISGAPRRSGMRPSAMSKPARRLRSFAARR